MTQGSCQDPTNHLDALMAAYNNVKCLHSCSISVKPAGEDCENSIVWAANDRWQPGQRTVVDDTLTLNGSPLNLTVNEVLVNNSITFSQSEGTIGRGNNKEDQTLTQMAFQLDDGSSVLVEL